MKREGGREEEERLSEQPPCRHGFGMAAYFSRKRNRPTCRPVEGRRGRAHELIHTFTHLVARRV